MWNHHRFRTCFPLPLTPSLHDCFAHSPKSPCLKDMHDAVPPVPQRGLKNCPTISHFEFQGNRPHLDILQQTLDQLELTDQSPWCRVLLQQEDVYASNNSQILIHLFPSKPYDSNAFLPIERPGKDCDRHQSD